MVGLIVTGYLWTHVSGDQPWLYHGGFLVAAAATAGVLVSAVCHQTGPLGRLLALSPLRFIGTISYGLYLWHFPLFLLLDRIADGITGVASFHPATGRHHCRGYGILLPGRAAHSARFAVAGPARLGGGPHGGRGCRGRLAPGHGARDRVLGAGVRSRPPAHILGSSPTRQLHRDAGRGLDGQYVRQRRPRSGRLLFRPHCHHDGIPDCGIADGTFRVQDFPPQAPAPHCQPSSGDPGWPVDWGKLLQTFDPSVSIFLARLDIVDHLMNGSWTHIGEPAFDAYLAGQLHLAVQTLTSRGGKVILMTTPYYSTGEQPDGQPWPEDNPERVNLYNDMIRQAAANSPARRSVRPQPTR